MREIKFRAWDKVKNKMLKIASINWACNRIGYYYKGKNQGECSLSNIILMQYTGLKDCKGNEVYVGDIVKHYRFERYDDKTNTILIDKKNYRIQTIEWSDYYCFFVTVMKNTTCERVSLYLHEYLEIIGNIYKNPELLKGEPK